MNGLRILAAILLLCTVSASIASAKTKDVVLKSFTILSGEIAVVANLLSNEHQDVDEWVHQFRLDVKYKNSNIPVYTIIPDRVSTRKAVSILKKTVGWKGHYLFVRSECGGGNAWRCDVDQVFKKLHGKLIRIGENYGGERERKIGPYYDNGVFKDIYDKLEFTLLTSHAASPFVIIVMRDAGEELKVDLGRTWQINLQYYDKNLDEIRRIVGTKFNESFELEQAIAVPLVFNASLAVYCGKETEYENMKADARRYLSDENYEKFLAVMSEVKCGELPRQRIGKDS